MDYPQTNDTIALSFIGKLDNGTIFESTEPGKPIRVTLGSKELPPSVEQAVMQMRVGESRKIRVSPEEGYGFREKNLLQVIDNPEIIARLNPKPGMIVKLKVDKEGTEHQVPATVIEVSESQITVDYNHPLAGHHLNFELTLEGIVKKSDS